MINSNWLQKKIPENIKRLGGEFIWISVGKVAAVLGGLIGIKLLTSRLEPLAYGQLALAMTGVTLVHQTVLGPVGSSASRFYAPAVEKNELSNFIKALSQIALWAVALIGSIVIFIIGFLLVTKKINWIVIIVLTSVFAIFDGTNSMFNSIQNAARHRSIVAFHQGIEKWMKYIIAAGLIIWLGSTSTIAMLGYVVAILFLIASQYFFFRNNIIIIDNITEIISGTDVHWRRKLINYSWPFAVWGIFTWANVASDRWALRLFTSTQEVGLYAVLFQLGYYPITILMSLMMNLVTPIFFQRVGDGSDHSRVRQVRSLNLNLTIASLLITFVLVLLSYFLHGIIFRMFTDPNYHSISWLLPGMVLSGGLFASGQFASIEMLNDMTTQNLIAPKVITAIVGLILNILGAALFGVFGVVIAGIIFSFSYFIWMVILIKNNY